MLYSISWFRDDVFTNHTDFKEMSDQQQQQKGWGWLDVADVL